LFGGGVVEKRRLLALGVVSALGYYLYRLFSARPAATAPAAPAPAPPTPPAPPPSPPPAIYASVETPEMRFTYDGLHPRTVYLTNVDPTNGIQLLIYNFAAVRACFDVNGSEYCCEPAAGGGGVVEGSFAWYRLPAADTVRISPKFTLPTRYDFVSAYLNVFMRRGVVSYHWECTDEAGGMVECSAAPVLRLVIDRYA
jgi:hypothetical protein